LRYPLDSTIHRLNNRGQYDECIRHRFNKSKDEMFAGISSFGEPFQSANGFTFPFYKPTKGWRFRYENKPAKTNVSPRSSPLGDVKRLFSQVT